MTQMPELDAAEFPPVSAHRSSPDRIVFTERDNTDGWIATDFAVDLRR